MQSLESTFIQAKEVCELLGISKQALWRMARAKQIPHQRFSERGRIKFVRKDIEQFLKDHSYKASGTADF